MKKKIALFALVIVINIQHLNCQVSTAANTGLSTHYVGWNVLQAFPLEIKHSGNQPVNFSTNGFRRMTITAGLGTSVGGRVLLSDDGAGVLPNARLHLYQKSNGNTNLLFSNLTTGTSATDGFEIFMGPSGDGFFTLREAATHHNFQTIGNGTTPLTRMRIFGDGLGQNTGRVVIGNDIPATFSPLARLHLHQIAGTSSNGKLMRSDGDSTTTSEWELYTGSTNANLVRKYRVFTSVPSIYNNNGGDVYQEANQGDFIFRVNGKRMGTFLTGNLPPDVAKTTTGTREVMRITRVYDNYLARHEGRVSISIDSTATANRTIRNPRSMLHIGEVSSGGWRPWMSVGTYFDYGTDCMYTGLRTINPTTQLDQNEAIIAWGDNPNDPIQPDRLRFVFTAANIVQNGIAGSNDGLEVMRMVAGTGSAKVGIGNFYSPNTNPANMLEVKSDAQCPYWSTSNSSGLRLTNLNSTSAIVPNGQNGINNLKLLTVDQNGDVVLTSAPAIAPASIPGNYCSATANPLTSNFAIPLNGNNYIFSGQSPINATSRQDIVGVGYNCAAILPLARFCAREAQSATVSKPVFAGFFENVDVLQNDDFLYTNGAVLGRSVGNQGGFQSTNAGGVFEANNANRSIGVIGRLGQTSVYTAASMGVGGMFIADTIPLPNANVNYDNYGVYAKATTGVNNYAVFAETSGPSNLSPTAPVGSFAGYFVGDVVRTGNDNFTSDLKLKKDVKTLTNGLEIISKIQTKTYSYNTDEYEQLNLPIGLQYGVIAQQVREIIPEVVNTVVHPAKYDKQGGVVKDKMDYLTVEYQQFIPLLINSIQELSQQNRKMDSVIKEMKESGYKANTNQNAHQITLSNQTIILEQNNPNPFKDFTSIPYSINTAFNSAKIVFSDSFGKVVNEYIIVEQGQGVLNIYANDLTNGIYTYYIIVDGNVIETKKMVKDK